MDKNIVSDINTALDAVMDEYLKNHQIIFANDSHRKAELYKSVERKLSLWNRSKACIFSGCTNKSIRRSHTIQKSGPLAAVSKNSTVLSPYFNHDIGEIILKPQGLTQSSVFPGFCSEHEMLFSKFENKKDFENNESFALQIYRSICREVVRLRHDITEFEKIIKEYSQLRDKALSDIVTKKLGFNWLKINKVDIRNLTLKLDPKVEELSRTLEDRRSTLKEIEKEHLFELEQEIEGKQNDNLRPVVITIDMAMPVTLSGLGSFWVLDDNVPRQILVILGVYPSIELNKTVITLHGKIADTNFINGYVNSHSNNFDILNMIEKFMIRGTDHWFLHPDIWEKKNSFERKKILAEILEGSKGLADNLEYSIFDDIRLQTIKALESTGKLDSGDIAIVACELKKLNNA